MHLFVMDFFIMKSFIIQKKKQKYFKYSKVLFVYPICSDLPECSEDRPSFKLAMGNVRLKYSNNSL